MDSPRDQSNRLLSLIVHELRAPGAVVSGYLRLLLKGGSQKLSEPERQMIEDASKCCARLLRVVQEIEEYTDIDRPERFQGLEPVRVFSLCEETVRETRASDGLLAFVCPTDDRLAIVRGEPHRLKQALAGLVALTVREHGARPVEVAGFVSHETSDPRAVIAFGSPGLVHADVLVARAAEFDPWRGGMGLVVPIASRILELHGGRIWSLQDAPAACAISLPLATP